MTEALKLRRKIAEPALETKRTAGLPGRDGLTVNLDGTIRGYASLFDQIDLGSDRMRRGAFSLSVAKRGAGNIRMLFQHDPDRPIGRWTRIEEDGRGLRVEGCINQDTALGRETLALVRGGALEGLSIGFKTVRATRPDANGVRTLLEVDLWEVSIVTFPMLPGAKIDAVKGAVLPAGLPSPRTLEHWLQRDAGLSRSAARALLSKGYGALIRDGARDAAVQNPLAETIRRATKTIQNRN